MFAGNVNFEIFDAIIQKIFNFIKFINKFYLNKPLLRILNYNIRKFKMDSQQKLESKMEAATLEWLKSLSASLSTN